MGALELQLHADAYELTKDGHIVARLAGGPAALVPHVGAPRIEHVEGAIERAEDWLMPFSRSLQDDELLVHDMHGRLQGRLATGTALGRDEVELAFTRAFDDVAFGRPLDRGALADLVLLRELVHHGSLSAVVVQGRE